MTEYKIPLEQLKKAGIDAKVGKGLSLQMKDGKIVEAKITKVGKDEVVAATK